MRHLSPSPQPSPFLIQPLFVFADPPEIMLKPRNQQVKAGGIASFYCAARGDPPPVIQWRKNGKRVSGRYYLLINANSSLINDDIVTKFEMFLIQMGERKK